LKLLCFQTWFRNWRWKARQNPVFPLGGFPDGAAQRIHHELHAVTDAQDRDSKIKNGAVYFGAVFFVNAGRPAGQDDAVGMEGTDGVNICPGWLNLTVYPAFPYPAAMS